MARPIVAIFGRPNVGKSSIFNWLVGKRVSIVEPTSGVTRDRVSGTLAHEGRTFDLVDTGGMGVEDRDGLTRDIEHQISVAIHEADVLLFVVDAMVGTVPLDQLVIERLRHTGKPLICVANKCDNPKLETQAVAECSTFGLPLIRVSAMQGMNREGLLEAIVAQLPPKEESEGVDEPVMKIAVVGKRNAGKSTFINCLAATDRMIVSEVEGTTRDSVDVRFEHNGKAFIAIDTAGVRRRKSIADSIEFYAYTRAKKTVRRADVVLFFIDATADLGTVDQQLVQFIQENHKPVILVVNKWDLLYPTGIKTGEYNERLDATFPGLSFAPRAFITAQTGKNVQALIDLAQNLFKQANIRVSTAEINRVIQAAIQNQPPPMRENRRPKLYFASQVSVAPPTIVLFTNEPRLFGASYRRYLANFCHDYLPFSEIPIHFEFRRRGSQMPGEGLETENVARPIIDEREPDEPPAE